MEDVDLLSINYLHFGASKVSYTTISFMSLCLIRRDINWLCDYEVSLEMLGVHQQMLAYARQLQSLFAFLSQPACQGYEHLVHAVLASATLLVLRKIFGGGARTVGSVTLKPKHRAIRCCHMHELSCLPKIFSDDVTVH